jgi:hypothetical protein
MCSMDTSPRADPMNKGQVLKEQQTALETASVILPPPKRKSSLSSSSFSSSSPTAASPDIATMTNKKIVKFDYINFQEHAVILGDNPGVQTGGPPVTIDWEPLRQYQLNLDQYEKAMGTRRSIQELRMPATVRQELLQDDCCMSEMKEAVKAAHKIKSQRQFTMTMAESSEGMEVFCASVGRKFKRALLNRRRRRASANEKSSTSLQEPAEQWMEQQYQDKSRRASLPQQLVHTNTRRNSMRRSYGYNKESQESADDSVSTLGSSAKDDEALIVAAAAHLSVS